MFDNRWIQINGKEEGKKKGKERIKERGSKEGRLVAQATSDHSQIKVNPISSPTSQSPLQYSVFFQCYHCLLLPGSKLRLSLLPGLVLFYTFFLNLFIKFTNQEPNPSFFTECLNPSTTYYSFCTSNLEFAPKLFSNLTNQSPIFGLFYSLPTEKLISLEKS